MTDERKTADGNSKVEQPAAIVRSDAQSEEENAGCGAENLSAGHQAVLDALATAEPINFPPADQMEERTAYSLSDLGNAHRLVQMHGDDLIYVPEQGWYHWDSTRWAFDGDQLAAQLKAHDVQTGILQEYHWLKEQGPRPGEDEKDFEKRIARTGAWAVQSGMSGRIEGMIKRARPYLSKPHDAFDADPRRITMAKKTLFLGANSTVEAYAVRRSDLITRSANMTYDPNAECPVFRAFLERVLPDREVRTFLQRFIGYCATGLTHEQCLLLLYGTGANGKSTLVEALQFVFGDYAISLPFRALLRDDRKQGSAPSPELARLPGARFVASSEADAGAAFSESLLKNLTGSDRITVRQLNKPFFDFYPTFKLVLSFNNRPRVTGIDEGVWRRLILVPFEQMIPPEERDKDLPAKLRAEGSGILNWILDGFREFAEKGLVPPPAVSAATRGYREDSDPIGQFLNDAVTYDKDGSVRSNRLFALYNGWCMANGVSPRKATGFGRQMNSRNGIVRKKDESSMNVYCGIRLKSGLVFDPENQVLEGSEGLER